MKRLFIIVLVSFVMFSCSDDSSSLEIYNDTRKQTEEVDGAYRRTNHFIGAYLVLDEIKVVHTYDGLLALALIGDEYYTCFGKHYKHYEFVESLSEFYGDTTYNGYTTESSNTSALAYPVDKMTMYCVTDFDAKHPAGKSVDDIVTLDFSSHYNFIQSGYKKNTNSNRHLQDVDCYTLPINKINAEVATLIALQRTLMVFNFTSTPETPGEYTFTLEMTTNGEMFKTTFTHTFE